MLNESKGNMYEFVTHTWNAIKGECEHDCSYCFMKRWGHLRAVRLEESEFRTNLGQDNFIFVGSSTDDFAANIPGKWIVRMLDWCDNFDNRYLFQSKNPGRILEFVGHPVFRKAVVCTTIETNRHYPDIMRNSPPTPARAEAMSKIAALGIPTFVTCEPLIDFDLPELVEMLRQCNPQQVNIGRNSRREVQLPEPDALQVWELIDEVKKFSKVEVKKNAARWML